jgi:hypothetical protein
MRFRCAITGVAAQVCVRNVVEKIHREVVLVR